MLGNHLLSLYEKRKNLQKIGMPAFERQKHSVLTKPKSTSTKLIVVQKDWAGPQVRQQFIGQPIKGHTWHILPVLSCRPRVSSRHSTKNMQKRLQETAIVLYVVTVLKPFSQYWATTALKMAANGLPIQIMLWRPGGQKSSPVGKPAGSKQRWVSRIKVMMLGDRREPSKWVLETGRNESIQSLEDF